MSRLEINFIRLLQETQKIANGEKTKDWTFEKERRSLLILYGSQTGTAEEIAERISREALRYFFCPIVLSLNDISIDDLKEKQCVIFIVATTGQGDDPDNMKLFFESLWNCRADRTLLQNLNFAVLGLGDSSYLKFNFAAKRLNKLLSIVGGKPLINIGLGDDQHELGPDFICDQWLKELWEKLLNLFKLPEGLCPLEKSNLLDPKYIIQYHENFVHNNIFSNVMLNGNDVIFSALTMNERRTSKSHFQDVRLIEFDVSSLSYTHKPGDVLMLQPQNLDKDVDEFISILGLDPNKMFTLIPNSSDVFLPPIHVLPQPCTIRQCVKQYFDILSIPKRYFFELLSFFTDNVDEKEKFLEFASSEGQQDYYDYCTRPRRSILEVLADFPHTNKNIPFDYLFDLIPQIKPRAYSIASSSITLPGKAQILMAVVSYKTILKRPRLGLCSNWLANLSIGSLVPVWIKPGTLKFPDNTNPIPPVIMIGPGTGCAPFRAYIQERIFSGNHSDILMVFGCRGIDKDYFFKEEWTNFEEDKKLKIFVAFSRDQDDKIYVQHILKQNYSIFWEYIKNPKSKIYYAGNAKRIPIDVYEALQFICEKGLNVSSTDAEKYMKNNVERRYQTESWV